MSASYVVFSTPHSRWIMRTPRQGGGARGHRGGVGPHSTIAGSPRPSNGLRLRTPTQIDDASRLSACTDSQPDPTLYPKHGSHGAPRRPGDHALRLPGVVS